MDGCDYPHSPLPKKTQGKHLQTPLRSLLDLLLPPQFLIHLPNDKYGVSISSGHFFCLCSQDPVQAAF